MDNLQNKELLSQQQKEILEGKIETLEFLKSLPRPDIMEEESWESLYQKRKELLIQESPNYAEALNRESDPLVALLQAGAYRELLLRKRINMAMKSQYLATATGTDLEHLAALYQVTRKPKESDLALRLRVQTAVKGKSGGTHAYYLSHAENIPGVRSVEVSRGKNGEIKFVILPKDDYCFTRNKSTDKACTEHCEPNPAGVINSANKCPATHLLIDKVKNYLNDRKIRMLSDTIEVHLAETVAFKIILQANLKSSSRFTLNEIEEAFKNIWDQRAVLGWEIYPLWIIDQLFDLGIKHIQTEQFKITRLSSDHNGKYCAYTLNDVIKMKISEFPILEAIEITEIISNEPKD